MKKLFATMLLLMVAVMPFAMAEQTHDQLDEAVNKYQAANDKVIRYADKLESVIEKMQDSGNYDDATLSAALNRIDYSQSQLIRVDNLLAEHNFREALALMTIVKERLTHARGVIKELRKYPSRDIPANRNPQTGLGVDGTASKQPNSLGTTSVPVNTQNSPTGSRITNVPSVATTPSGTPINVPDYERTQWPVEPINLIERWHMTTDDNIESMYWNGRYRGAVLRDNSPIYYPTAAEPAVDIMFMFAVGPDYVEMYEGERLIYYELDDQGDLREVYLTLTDVHISPNGFVDVIVDITWGRIFLDLTPPIPGDVNKDGQVDQSDLSTVVNQWGNCATCVEDLTNDGIVDANDALIVQLNWNSNDALDDASALAIKERRKP